MSFPGEIYRFLYQCCFLAFGAHAGAVWRCVWAVAAIGLVGTAAYLPGGTRKPGPSDRSVDIMFCFICALAIVLGRLPSL